jgi:hypothetical protein
MLPPAAFGRSVIFDYRIFLDEAFAESGYFLICFDYRCLWDLAEIDGIIFD